MGPGRVPGPSVSSTLMTINVLHLSTSGFADLVRRLSDQPDGTIAVHSQSEDEVNEVRKDINATYIHEIKESDKERKSSQGSGYMGMGSMMGGGMGGRGMMGGGMGGGPR